MKLDATFVHTNLMAENWRELADFYVRVFGCEIVLPERDYAGELLARGSGLPNARLRGAHLRLPGLGKNGPTLEIFTYDEQVERMPAAVNRPGYGHIAFQVADVPSARDLVLAAGGSAVGEVVTLSVASGARVTWCYVTDPEGNIVELQSWT